MPPPRPIAVVRIRISDLAIEWLEAVTELLEAIDDAQDLVPFDIAYQAERVRKVMLTPNPPGEIHGAVID